MEDEMAALATMDVMVGLPPIFREATDPHATRYDLSRPWVERGGDGAPAWVVATDGRIAVRVPAGAADAEVIRSLSLAACDGKKRPKVAALIDARGEYRDGPVTWPAAIPPGMVACPDCDGTGRWPMCEKNIGDDPTYPCEDCDGAGEVWNNERVTLTRGYDLSAHFADMLARHGATAYLPLVLMPWRADYGLAELPPLYFTLPGGVDGLVMPMRPVEG